MISSPDEGIGRSGRALHGRGKMRFHKYQALGNDYLVLELADEATLALFPNRTNVQFVKVLDPHRIQIEIWERGAGYTLASGSSSCAAAAASVRLGLCSGDITVLMPGGALDIGVSADFALTMLGPVGKISDGVLSRELLQDARDV